MAQYRLLVASACALFVCAQTQSALIHVTRWSPLIFKKNFQCQGKRRQKPIYIHIWAKTWKGYGDMLRSGLIRVHGSCRGKHNIKLNCDNSLFIVDF